MGGNPRHSTWSHKQWASVAYTVAEIIANGWRVEAGCQACSHRFRVRLDVIRRIKGADFVLWGKAASCPRVRCSGAVWFYVKPRQAEREFLMLGASPPPRADRDAARMLT